MCANAMTDGPREFCRWCSQPLEDDVDVWLHDSDGHKAHWQNPIKRFVFKVVRRHRREVKDTIPVQWFFAKIVLVACVAGILDSFGWLPWT